MTYYAGLDVSLRTVNICVIDDQGELVAETKMIRVSWLQKQSLPLTFRTLSLTWTSSVLISKVSALRLAHLRST